MPTGPTVPRGGVPHPCPCVCPHLALPGACTSPDGLRTAQGTVAPVPREGSRPRRSGRGPRGRQHTRPVLQGPWALGDSRALAAVHRGVGLWRVVWPPGQQAGARWGGGPGGCWVWGEAPTGGPPTGPRRVLLRGLPLRQFCPLIPSAPASLTLLLDPHGGLGPVQLTPSACRVRGGAPGGPPGLTQDPSCRPARTGPRAWRARLCWEALSPPAGVGSGDLPALARLPPEPGPSVLLLPWA